MTNLPVKPGIDGIPTGLIPTDPAAFVDWFKNSFLPRWAANADIRNATPGAGVKISGTSDTPGFVGFDSIGPLSVLGNPTNAVADVEAIPATADGAVLQRSGGVLTFNPLTVADSITGAADTASPLKLINDADSPGNSQYYGTDGAGVKGYHPVSTNTVAVPGTIPDLQLWWESDDILGNNGTDVTRLRERTPAITGVSAICSSLSPAFVENNSINGLPALRFTSSFGTGYAVTGPFNMNTNSGGPGVSRQGTIFFVATPNGTTASQAITGGASGCMAVYLNLIGVPNVALVDGSVAVVGSSTVPWTPGTSFQGNATFDGASGSWALRQSRASAGGNSTGSSGMGTGAIQFIAADPGSPGNGVINDGRLAAVIIYSRQLTATEIVNVENYLFAKWGV